MAETNATPGTTMTGPVEIVAAPDLTAFVALPAVVDDSSTGTADAVDYTLVEVTDTTVDVSGLINDNFATLAALLDAILERVQ
jgi:hypothetical protein